MEVIGRYQPLTETQPKLTSYYHWPHPPLWVSIDKKNVR